MALDLSTYPPKGHEGRITGYQRFEQLFLGQHKTVFAVTPQPYQMKRYIAANFAGLISRLSADLLFGEEPDFIAAQDDEAAKETLTAIVSRNRLHATNYESALSNSFRGDAVYKVRWGKRIPQSEQPEAIIEEIPASIYFPELDDDDVRKVTRVRLAWVKRVPTDTRRAYLRVEAHEPGVIRGDCSCFESRQLAHSPQPPIQSLRGEPGILKATPGAVLPPPLSVQTSRIAAAFLFACSVLPHVMTPISILATEQRRLKTTGPWFISRAVSSSTHWHFQDRLLATGRRRPARLWRGQQTPSYHQV